MMNKKFTKRTYLVVGVCCLIIAAVMLPIAFAAEKPAGYEEGLKHYENNEPDKAIKLFKNALATAFPGQAEKAPADEKVLLSQLDDKKTASLANYQLGLIYEAQGKLDEAATKYRNALTVTINGGVKYIGAKKCKMCHIKQYRSWEKTKMAKAFEVLKPGMKAEAKAKLKFDPKKDYTKTPKCLACHTTGFGLPGGYKIPQEGDLQAVKAAKNREGITCEACHGPASKYITVHKKILSKRHYTFKELQQAGQNKVNASACTTCHNRRNRDAGSDFHFDYEKEKTEDAHKNIPLKYRKND